MRFCEASVFRAWRRTHWWIRYCSYPSTSPFGIDIECMRLWLVSALHLLLVDAIEALLHTCTIKLFMPGDTQ